MLNDIKKYIKSRKSKVVQIALWVLLAIPLMLLGILHLISMFKGGNNTGNDTNVDIERVNEGTRVPQNTGNLDNTIDNINQDINQ